MVPTDHSNLMKGNVLLNKYIIKYYFEILLKNKAKFFYNFSVYKVSDTYSTCCMSYKLQPCDSFSSTPFKNFFWEVCEPLSQKKLMNKYDEIQ